MPPTSPSDGAFTIAGTDRAMPILQVAQMSFIYIGFRSSQSTQSTAWLSR
jgi:hypothetical protein